MVKLATICYVDNGKEWLMLHRNKKVNDVHAGKWIGVGGKLEPGETPEDCAIREVKEETGLTVKKLCGLVNQQLLSFPTAFCMFWILLFPIAVIMGIRILRSVTNGGSAAVS